MSFPLIEIIQPGTCFLFIFAVKSSEEHTLSFQLQTDLDLRSRTFSLKINKLPTFSETNQGWQCLKTAFRDELNFNFTLFCLLLSEEGLF